MRSKTRNLIGIVLLIILIADYIYTDKHGFNKLTMLIPPFIGSIGVIISIHNIKNKNS